MEDAEGTPCFLKVVAEFTVNSFKAVKQKQTMATAQLDCYKPKLLVTNIQLSFFIVNIFPLDLDLCLVFVVLGFFTFISSSTYK